MELKNHIRYKNRRLPLIAVKYAIVVMLLFCAVGGAMAANDTFTMYTDDDMDAAQSTWSNSGAGVLVALVVLVAVSAPYLILILLALLAIVAKLAQKSEAHTFALQAMFWVILIMLVLVIAIDLITSMCPDISTITIGR